MGLFVNDEQHPDVFTNNTEIYEPNQTFYKNDPVDEMMKEQQLANEALQRSLGEMETVLKKQEQIQSSRLSKLNLQLTKLSEQHSQHEDHESRIVEWLEKHETKNGELEGTLKQQLDLQKQVVEQLGNQGQLNEEIVNRMENQEALSEKIIRQVDFLRSVLFERSHFLAEKIESGYLHTTSYINKFLTRSEPQVEESEVKEKSKEYS